MGDADPRASEILPRLRSMWDDAQIRSDLDGQRIRLPGYVVPIEMGKTGLSEFLLVPYFFVFIHTPPPPSNQIVHVRLNKPVQGINSMDTVWIDGVVTVKRTTSLMGTSAYRMDVAAVLPYSPFLRRPHALLNLVRRFGLRNFAMFKKALVFVHKWLGVALADLFSDVVRNWHRLAFCPVSGSDEPGALAGPAKT